MADLLELIRSRRSVRRFTSELVADEVIEELLEAMRWAPSAGNAQPYRIHVVRDDAIKAQLSVAALGQRFIAEAPVVVVVTTERFEAQRAYRARGEELYCIQDSAAAIQNLLLLAHSKGLGACWVGAFRERSVAEALSLPGEQRPVAVIPVGVPATTPNPPRRRSLRELAQWH
jgi:nitroreductase